MSFPKTHVATIENRGRVALGLVCALFTSGMYVFASSRGVVTIDVARDLYWANEIASGSAFPVLGPPIGGMNLLGPVWFYLASIPAALTTSLEAYFGWLAVLAAAKFVLAFAVGLAWRGPATGIALVAASALPGLASYQLFGVTHPQMVEVAVWGCAWFAVRYRKSGKGVDALAAGVMAGLSLHAHPTAVFLAPWALSALLWPTCGATKDGRHASTRMGASVALLLAACGAALVFAPRLAAFATPIFTADGGEGVANGPSIASLMAAIWAYVVNLAWLQPSYFVKVSTPQFASTMLASIAAIWVVTTTGFLCALWSRLHRRAALAALATLLLCLIAVAGVRTHTPFYMLYVALLPWVVLIAVSWCALLDFVWGKWIWGVVVLAALLLHTLTAFGLVREGNRGYFDVPVHLNMKLASTEVRRDLYVPATTRDALVDWLCARPQPVSLHGDLAVALDISLRLELARGCTKSAGEVRLGGIASAFSSLPVVTTAKFGLRPSARIGAFGLVPVSRVVSPASELTPASGQIYPPRLNDMKEAASTAAWRETIVVERSEVLVVSSLLPLPAFVVTASANDVASIAKLQYSGTSMFTCFECDRAPVRWQIEVSGNSRAFTSIVTLRTGQ